MTKDAVRGEQDKIENCPVKYRHDEENNPLHFFFVDLKQPTYRIRDLVFKRWLDCHCYSQDNYSKGNNNQVVNPEALFGVEPSDKKEENNPSRDCQDAFANIVSCPFHHC